MNVFNSVITSVRKQRGVLIIKSYNPFLFPRYLITVGVATMVTLPYQITLKHCVAETELITERYKN